MCVRVCAYVRSGFCCVGRFTARIIRLQQRQRIRSGCTYTITMYKTTKITATKMLQWERIAINCVGHYRAHCEHLHHALQSLGLRDPKNWVIHFNVTPGEQQQQQPSERWGGSGGWKMQCTAFTHTSTKARVHVCVCAPVRQCAYLCALMMSLPNGKGEEGEGRVERWN